MESGIGGYDLASGNDRAFAFDGASRGRLDHIVAYRPGDGRVAVSGRTLAGPNE